MKNRTRFWLLVSALLLVMILPLAMGSCQKEECKHSNIELIEVPTKTHSGRSACLECHRGEAIVELPPLTDASFYDIQVVDADVSTCTFQLFEKTFTLYATNFEIEALGNYDNNGALKFENGYRIVGYYGSSATVTIPTEYNDGYNGKAPVMVVGSFAENKSVKEIIFTPSVERIEARAFRNCSALENIVIPNTVTNIGWEIFAGCNSLKSVTIPQIGATDELGYSDDFGDLFGDDNGDAANVPTSLKTVTITGNITEVNSFAFYNCKSIETLNLPASVAKIDEYAFYQCSGLKYLNLSTNLSEIGSRAFDGCTGLQGFYYDGSEEQWEEIAVANDVGEAFDEVKVLFYAENEPTVIEFINADQALWHYNEQGLPTVWDISVNYTNLVDGKTYYHYSATVEVREEYWQMLKLAEAEGMIDEVFATPEEKQIYLNSISKEDYQARLTIYTQEQHAGMEIAFADGRFTLSQNGQSSYPSEYIEINNALIYDPLIEVIAYTIEDGKVCQENSNEYLTVKHTYLPYS